jgi:hypothetical protein
VHDAAYALRNQIEGDRGRPTSRIEGGFPSLAFGPVLARSCKLSIEPCAC